MEPLHPDKGLPASPLNGPRHPPTIPRLEKSGQNSICLQTAAWERTQPISSSMGKQPGGHPHTHEQLPKSVPTWHTTPGQRCPSRGNPMILTCHPGGSPGERRSGGRDERQRQTQRQGDEDPDQKQSVSPGREGNPLLLFHNSAKQKQRGKIIKLREEMKGDSAQI